MFTKIEIKKFGLFKDFRWPNSGLTEFERVNVIYGRNYSGKTTLSRIFDCVAQGELHKDYPDAEFTLFEDGGLSVEREGGVTSGAYQVTNSDLSYGGKVRVYNSDYVNRNLSWLRNEETGEIKPFALIGGVNIEAQKKIEEMTKELGDVESKTGLRYEYKVKYDAIDKALKENTAAQNKLDAQIRDKANRDIKANGYFVKQGTSYTVNNLKTDIETITNKDESGTITMDDSFLLDPESGEEERLKKTVEEALKPM